MRIRDIQQTGFYGRLAPELGGAHDNEAKRREDAIQAVHVTGVLPMFVVALARWCNVPLIADANGNIGIIPPEILFGDHDNWRFLCDGSEPGFGPHTFLMKTIQLAGYAEDDARRMARERLVEDLDRRIYGSAQPDA